MKSEKKILLNQAYQDVPILVTKLHFPKHINFSNFLVSATQMWKRFSDNIYHFFEVEKEKIQLQYWSIAVYNNLGNH